MVTGRFLSRPIFRFVHASRLPEMSTFISLLLVLAIAFLMVLVGLSPALGTFVAGVVLANSEFRHQIEADIKPFKGLLLGLFFMTVGVGIDFDVLARAPGTVIGLTIAVIVVKATILFGIAVFAGLRGRDRFLFTLGLAQAGEFGFLLISFARAEGALAVGASDKALLVISLSMLVTPLLFALCEGLAKFLPYGADAPEPDAVDEKGRVIIAGRRAVRADGEPALALGPDVDRGAGQRHAHHRDAAALRHQGLLRRSLAPRAAGRGRPCRCRSAGCGGGRARQRAADRAPCPPAAARPAYRRPCP
ncbi:hypothetical protein MASR1M32_18590 [Rhodobacter sp.]